MTSLQKTLLGITLSIISLIMALCGLYPFNLFLSLAGGVLIGLFHKEGHSELKQLWKNMKQSKCPSENNYNLFLDDLRHPCDAFGHTDDSDFLQKKWMVVRNYEQFCSYIKRGYKKGFFPEVIAFDHDLAPEHYTPQEYWSDYATSKAYQESRIYKEKNGKGCAQWLVEFCEENELPLPMIKVHSMNPVGADNIREVLGINNANLDRTA